MKFFIAFCLFFNTYLAFSQISLEDCTEAEYKSILKEAEKYVQEKRYDLADLKFRAARVCRPENALIIDGKLIEVRKAIEKQ